ncbi:single-stranded-DNA-specific exonuclease, partial [Candidatus Fervidibacteria bacterium JGI MDM2 SSWTFF-3-K9]
ELEALEPTGYGNPKPVLMLQNAKLVYAEKLPAQGTSRLLVRVRQGERVLELVGDGMGELVNELQLGSTVHVCFTAEVKYTNGIPTLDLQIVDIAPANSERIILRQK